MAITKIGNELSKKEEKSNLSLLGSLGSKIKNNRNKWNQISNITQKQMDMEEELGREVSPEKAIKTLER